ncbi:hypothetical protein OF83DRAFT_95955 [Amylostereum chailletii]|nr:hypothetical protein OF83DRAFT_96137 [Amylostereum chailletii]KAI0309203.1 hypothetical protein OF83DRAFT_95955 [Amylostereum chailletii]
MRRWRLISVRGTIALALKSAFPRFPWPSQGVPRTGAGGGAPIGVVVSFGPEGKLSRMEVPTQAHPRPSSPQAPVPQHTPSPRISSLSPDFSHHRKSCTCAPHLLVFPRGQFARGRLSFEERCARVRRARCWTGSRMDLEREGLVGTAVRRRGRAEARVPGPCSHSLVGFAGRSSLVTPPPFLRP